VTAGSIAPLVAAGHPRDGARDEAFWVGRWEVKGKPQQAKIPIINCHLW